MRKKRSWAISNREQTKVQIDVQALVDQQEILQASKKELQNSEDILIEDDNQSSRLFTE